jgi:hypothetical protein
MDENPQLSRLPSCQILFRALPYKDLVRPSDGKHRHQSFMLRPDEGGLSLFTSIQGCKEHFEQPIFGIRSAQVSALREYGLEVFPDADDHGNIRQADGQSIPHKSQNPPAAFQVADDLMDRSRPVDYWNESNADELFARDLEAKREARRAAGQ